MTYDQIIAGTPPKVVGVDTQFSFRDVEELQRRGFTVVHAESGESDNHWFARAVDAGARMICSPDRDLSVLCYDHEVHYLRLSGASAPKRVDIVCREWDRLGKDTATYITMRVPPHVMKALPSLLDYLDDAHPDDVEARLVIRWVRQIASIARLRLNLF